MRSLHQGCCWGCSSLRVKLYAEGAFSPSWQKWEFTHPDQEPGDPTQVVCPELEDIEKCAPAPSASPEHHGGSVNFPGFSHLSQACFVVLLGRKLSHGGVCPCGLKSPGLPGPVHISTIFLAPAPHLPRSSHSSHLQGFLKQI